ncbi:hypothetical protein BJ322DRAFT_1109487 [Thelephora terrestris]|uniref:Uncharacterized protein n=1 Tax=Thelephora terrestris TaxID=56493 RepID=A0A9P6L6V1_9AGAM|nr:hypothetical protein BJ322DRAFT_1109487 [Thelephora terrestris]
MESESSVHSSQDEVVYESLETLRAQIKEIEDKWNDELKRLETARKDKEELEKVLHVLQAFVEYERGATLKMETMLQETRDALGIPSEAGRERFYDPSKSTGSYSSGESSVLEFDLVYNPNGVLRVPVSAPSASAPPSIADAIDQATTVSPPQQTPNRRTSKSKFSPNWKNRIASILVNINNHNRTSPLSSSPRSFDSTTPLFNDADSPSAKPKRTAKPQKRPSQDSENRGTVGWRRTVGSAGSKFAIGQIGTLLN